MSSERGGHRQWSEDSSWETGDSGGRAVACDGETVDSDSATGILDGQSGAQARTMEIRAEKWDSRW